MASRTIPFGLLPGPPPPAPPFDPTDYGINWHSLYWAEDPAWTPPAEFGAVTSWRDMSGNGRTLTQATAARQPGYWPTTAVLNNKPAVQFPGLLLSDTFTAVAQPLTILFVGQMYHPKFAAGTSAGIGFDSAIASRVTLAAWSTSSNGRLRGFAGTLLGNTRHFEPVVARFKAHGASSALQVGTAAAQTGAGGSATLTRIALGQREDWLNGLTFTNYGMAAMVGVYSGDITAEAQWDQFMVDLIDHYQLAAPRALIICDGDSRTEGIEAGPELHGNTYPAHLTRHLTDPVTVVNVGISGQTVAAMTADVAYNDALYDASLPANVVVMAGGINDCNQAASAATLQSRIETYCAARRSAGFDVVACTIPPAVSVTGSEETVRTTVNTWMRANWATWSDVLVDLAADSRLDDTSDTTYFDSDGVHFSAEGHSVIAELVASALADLGIA